MDKVSTSKRSEIMSRVRSRDTKPELIVRRVASSLGFRYRANVKDLPGKPDLAIKCRKKAIFVHGCFWHRHKNCKMASTPVSNSEYWEKKFSSNKERDKIHMKAYEALGWKPLIIWECETRDESKLRNVIKRYLSQ